MEITDVRTMENEIGGEINDEPVVNNNGQQADNIGENAIEEPVQEQLNGEHFTAIQEMVKYGQVCWIIITPMEQIGVTPLDIVVYAAALTAIEKAQLKT